MAKTIGAEGSISYGERMILCEEKAIEADELRNERHEFSRAK